MLPGRQIRIHPMKAAAGNAKCFKQYRAIRLPVRPRPALQWTAMAPGSLSAISKNLATILGFGGVPSVKNNSRCLRPLLRNLWNEESHLSFVELVVQPHHLSHPKLLEDGSVVLWCQRAVALVVARFIAWTGKCDKSSGNNPVQIAILNSLIVFILFVVEVRVGVPSQPHRAFEARQTVLDCAFVCAHAHGRVSEWSES